jgi:AraC-like DNA-binding protein
MKMKRPPTSPEARLPGHLQTLVENRQVFTLHHSELNLFETYQRAEQVRLQFPDLVLTSMVRGKKVMHLFGQAGFAYLPGEAVIVPPGEAMLIDFPEARLDNPTQCLALAVSADKIREVMAHLNEQHPKAETGEQWHLDLHDFHLQQNPQLHGTLQRLVSIYHENNRAKEIFADLTLNELLIRLMQTQAARLLLHAPRARATSHRFAFVAQYIHDNLHRPLTVAELSEKACMSQPHFFRCFKAEFGLSPVDYILQLRVAEAKQLLLAGRLNVTQVCLAVGFNNLNYFIRAFKKQVGVAPNLFRKQAG